MCLAEALLRVPDSETADRLIRDKIGGGAWDRNQSKSDSVFVNASTWALMLTGRVVQLEAGADWDFEGILTRLVARSGEPVIRQAVTYAMAPAGAPIRPWTDYRRGAQRGQAASQARVPLLLRHAGRSGADKSRCRAVSRRLSLLHCSGFTSYSKTANNIFECSSISVKLSASIHVTSGPSASGVLRELIPILTALGFACAGVRHRHDDRRGRG